MIKEKRGVRDPWNLLQANFKRKQQKEQQASGIDCDLPEKDTLKEELCEREESFSAKEKRSLMIKRQVKKSERELWNAWARKKIK